MLHGRVIRPPAVGADAPVGRRVVDRGDSRRARRPPRQLPRGRRRARVGRGAGRPRAPDPVVRRDRAARPRRRSPTPSARPASCATRTWRRRATSPRSARPARACRRSARRTGGPSRRTAPSARRAAWRTSAPDRATIWTSSQATHRFRETFARLLGLPRDKVRLIYLDGAGSYGQAGAEDAACDAALLSRAVGRPVRVQWTREDEHGWDPKGPPQLLDLRAAVGEGGDVLAWETQAWLPVATQGLPSIPLLAPLEAGHQPAPRALVRPDPAEHRPALPGRGGPRRRALGRGLAVPHVAHPDAGQDRQHLRRRVVRGRGVRRSPRSIPWSTVSAASPTRAARK